MAAPKKNKDESVSIEDIFDLREPKLSINPDTGLVEQVFEEDDKVNLEKQLWGKNPKRSQALRDLWFEDLQKIVEEGKEPDNVKKELAFLMTTNNVIDLIMGALPEDLALEVSYSLDNTIALALVNKQYDCDLLEEEAKAVGIVKREDYKSDDDYQRALEAIEEHWWSIGQPQLEMRSANDALIETMRKYGLNE